MKYCFVHSVKARQRKHGAEMQIHIENIQHYINSKCVESYLTGVGTSLVTIHYHFEVEKKKTLLGLV